MERVRGILGLLLLLVSCEPSTDVRGPLQRPSGPALPVPAGATASRVRSAYDGDTLTLQDGRKVRLLGVDTPELQQREPFAAEARDFVRSFCEDREVWLEFDAEPEDRYGRLLCYVYVREGNQARMLNAELLRSGLARFYTPGSGLRHGELLLACQREAREQRRGTWKDYVFEARKQVVVTKSGHAFHRPDCREIRNANSLRTIEEGAALDQGLSRCRTCKP